MEQGLACNKTLPTEPGSPRNDDSAVRLLPLYRVLLMFSYGLDYRPIGPACQSASGNSGDCAANNASHIMRVAGISLSSLRSA